MKYSLLLLAVVPIALAAADVSAQNLIVNPNFSANASSFGGVGYANSGGNPFITGYAQVGGNGYGVNGPDTNPGGTPLEYFAPTGYTPVAGTDYGFEQNASGPVSQSGITLTPGKSYMLSFVAGTRNSDFTATGTFTLTDTASGVTLLSMLESPGGDTADSNGNPMPGTGAGFVSYSGMFTDTSTTSATLTIQNLTSGSSLAFTNLSLTAVVPEPGTYVLYGLGALVLVAVARRSSLKV